MTYDPLENLLVSAWKELAQYLPEEATHAALYLELERMSGETDEKGNPTPQAHRAKARLRNVNLVEETNAKSKGKVLKNQAKLEKELVEVVSRALVLLVASRANAARLAHIDSYEERQLPVGKSREQHDPESKFALASPFVDRLCEAGASPSALGRLTAFMVQFIALLVKAHADDPKLENPDNIWNRIVRAGILEAYQKNLDADYLKVVAQAACERDEQTNEWARKATEDLDLPSGMDDRFLEGAARLCDAARSLSPGEAEAYYDAFSLQDGRDVERLAPLLGLDQRDDRIRLMAVIDFVKRANAPLQRDWKSEMQLAIMKREIDKIEPHRKWHRDWKAELLERLAVLGEQLSEMGSVEAFNALLKSGLGASEADFEFIKRLERDVADGDFIALENTVRAACKSGRSFKVYDQGVVYSHEENYYDIEAQEWTGHEWRQVFGAWPGEDQVDVGDEDDAMPLEPVADEPGDIPDEDMEPPPPETSATDAISETETGEVATEDDGEKFGPGPGDLADEPDDLGDDIEDFDWQDENPDLTDLNIWEGVDSSTEAPSIDEADGKRQEPETSGPANAAAEEFADAETGPEASDKPRRPDPYLPHYDDEEDDWDE